MKAREKRRRRQLRKARQAPRWLAGSGLRWPEDFADCISTGPSYGEVGYLGDIDHLLEYPCNCSYCRGEPPVTPEEEAEAGRSL